MPIRSARRQRESRPSSQTTGASASAARSLCRIAERLRHRLDDHEVGEREADEHERQRPAGSSARPGSRPGWPSRSGRTSRRGRSGSGRARDPSRSTRGAPRSAGPPRAAPAPATRVMRLIDASAIARTEANSTRTTTSPPSQAVDASINGSRALRPRCSSLPPRRTYTSRHGASNAAACPASPKRSKRPNHGRARSRRMRRRRRLRRPDRRAADRAGGRSVVVLEARRRVGGRVWTDHLADGTPIDRGGAWLGPGQDRLYALAAEMGVATYPTFVGRRPPARRRAAACIATAASSPAG